MIRQLPPYGRLDALEAKLGDITATKGTERSNRACAGARALQGWRHQCGRARQRVSSAQSQRPADESIRYTFREPRLLIELPHVSAIRAWSTRSRRLPGMDKIELVCARSSPNCCRIANPKVMSGSHSLAPLAHGLLTPAPPPH